MGDTEDLLGWCSVLSRRGDGHPFVVDADGQRSLQFDGITIQRQMALGDPLALTLDYTRLMMGLLLYHPAPRRIAMIGLGGGAHPIGLISLAQRIQHRLDRRRELGGGDWPTGRRRR